MQRASTALDGVETEVTIQNYADSTLVLVTQLGKVGHLIQASIPVAVPLRPPPPPSDDGLPLIDPSPAIELTSLFGTAPSTHFTTLHSLYASHIATLIWTSSPSSSSSQGGDRRVVIVGLALKNSHDTRSEDAELTAEEQATFRGVIKMIFDLLRGRDR